MTLLPTYELQYGLDDSVLKRTFLVDFHWAGSDDIDKTIAVWWDFLESDFINRCRRITLTRADTSANRFCGDKYNAPSKIDKQEAPLAEVESAVQGLSGLEAKGPLTLITINIVITTRACCSRIKTRLIFHECVPNGEVTV